MSDGNYIDDEEKGKNDTFESLSDRDLDLFTNPEAAKSYYMTNYDYGANPGKSYYSMHMDTDKQQKPTQWIVEHNLYLAESKFFFLRHLAKYSRSRFHRVDMSGTNTIFEWTPYKPVGALDQILIKKRNLSIRLNIRRTAYILSINYRWGIKDNLVEAGYGRWISEIHRALKNDVTRKISSAFTIERNKNYG
jgi:hypothetical protein